VGLVGSLNLILEMPRSCFAAADPTISASLEFLRRGSMAESRRGDRDMKWMVLLLASFALVFSTACEDRDAGVDEGTEYREPAPTEPQSEAVPREEGPAERTGRIVDKATKRAAEAVGRGLEEAGREIQENVPEPDRRTEPAPE
jgi:hypothetical protein